MLPSLFGFAGMDMQQPGFVGFVERLARLSGFGDQLEAFSRAEDFKRPVRHWRGRFPTATPARAVARRSTCRGANPLSNPSSVLRERICRSVSLPDVQETIVAM